MVNSINELSEVSRRLNQKSDKINAVIKGINEKLDALNFGLEVWLDAEDLADNHWQSQPESQNYREKSVIFLGYCAIEGTWQLAVKGGTLTQVWDRGEIETEELTNVEYKTLLKATRTIRMKALPLIPQLLDLVKAEAEKVINSIDEAGEAAENL
jgi:hypothetical protein